MKTILILLLGAITAHAELAVTVAPVKITGQTAVVPLALKNNMSQKVESAKAVVFLMDEQGKMAGTATRWVISSAKDQVSGVGSGAGGLATGATNSFNFVVKGAKPFASTNLTAKVSFTRVVLEGGTVADVMKDVVVTAAKE